MEFENKAKDAENRGDLLSAIKYYFKALKYIKEIKLVEGHQFDSGKILHRISNLYTEIGDFDNAIKYYKEASKSFLESDEALTKIYRLAGECHSSIGACYLTSPNYKKALEHFQKAVEYTMKATEFEDEILKRYVVERIIFNLALITICLIYLKKNKKEIIPLLEKAATLNKNYKVTGLSPNLILFFTYILTEKFSEARILLKNEIEDAMGSSLLSSTLEATVTGLILELTGKYIPEARIQIKDQVIEEKGEVILTTQLYEDMLLHGLSFANEKMSSSKYKEVYGLVVGKIKKDNVIVTEIVPMASGSEVEVEFKNEHYTKAATIDSVAAERNEFTIGWYHTHPGIGLFLSPTDIINQLGYQTLNDKAIAIVFDFTLLTPLKSGFGIFRLDDPSMGQTSNYHLVRWQIKDASKNIYAEKISFFKNFLTNLNNLVLKNRQMSLAQLAEELNRSELLLNEIIPQLVVLQYIPNTHYDSKTKVISLK